MLEKIKNNWQTIKNIIRDEYNLSSISFETWIKPLEVSDLKDDTLYVVFTGESTDFAITHLTKRFSNYFQITIEENIGKLLNIVFVTEQKPVPSRIFNKQDFPVNEYRLNNTDPKFTFDRFVVGANNQMAHAAALTVAERPGKVYNPLFIYGGSGLGKTHLMHAIANFITKNDKNAKVLYVTSESFMNELIEAIQKNKKNNTEAMSYFKKKYRNVDILLIDDIQFIIGRAETTMEEFFNTFNYLIESGKQIVISSDTPPNEFQNLEERLKSRFMQGIIVDISLPDYETRMAILRDKAENEGYSIDNEILNYIATNIKSNIRTLEGALNKISAYSKLNSGKAMTLEIAKENLKDLVDPEEENKRTPEYIISVVADYFNVRPEDIKSKKRTKDVTLPRHIAIYLIRILTDNTLEDVGRILGNRDHTTVSYGFKNITDSIKEQAEIKSIVDLLRKKILQ